MTASEKPSLRGRVGGAGPNVLRPASVSLGLFVLVGVVADQPRASTRRLHQSAARARRLRYARSETHRRLKIVSARLDERRLRLHRASVALYKLSRGGWARALSSTDNERGFLRSMRTFARLIERQSQEISLFHRDLDAHHAELARLGLPVPREAPMRTDKPIIAVRRGQLRWPVAGYVCTGFGYHRDRVTGLRYIQRGVAFRTSPKAVVRAVAAGTIAHTGSVSGAATTVVVEHGGGYRSVAAWLDRAQVVVGQRVRRGQVLGRAGRDPASGQPALYFEFRRWYRTLDPLTWLRRPVRLPRRSVAAVQH